MGRLTGCCWCFDLRDGARAIGITLLVLTSLAFIGAIVGVANAPTAPAPAPHPAGVAAQFVHIILHIIFNVLLIYGVNSDSQGMLLAWLIYTGIVTGMDSVAVVVLFILFSIFGVWTVTIATLVAAVIIAVIWYWFVVVLHYYQELKEGSNSSSVDKPKA